MTRAIRLGIVDDHPAIAVGVPAGLHGHLRLADGWHVATTVGELIEVVDQLDVVLLDIRLQDGSAPAENVRRLSERGWPVLLFTQVRQPSVVAACLQGRRLRRRGQARGLGCVGRGDPYGGPW